MDGAPTHQIEITQRHDRGFVGKIDHASGCPGIRHERHQGVGLTLSVVVGGTTGEVRGDDQKITVLRGREIEFDLEEERVRVTGAASVVIRPEENGVCAGDDL